MRKPRQIVMHCPCGNAKVLARGVYATFYTRKRQDEEYFGGHREQVLKRDDSVAAYQAVWQRNEESGPSLCTIASLEITPDQDADTLSGVPCEGHPDPLRAG